MNDLISRQAAIDAIEKWGLIDGLSEGQAIEILLDEEKIPPVLPKPKTGEWFPVSERLPEEKGWYRCTIIVNALPRTMELFYKNGKWVDNRRIDMFNTYDIYGYGYTNEKHKLSYQELISEFDWTEEVVAWMSLQDPYVAESEVEE